MPPASYGPRRGIRRKDGADLRGMPRHCDKLFIDSGAHTIYNDFTRDKPADVKYEWFLNKAGTKLSKAFRTYMDDYADFVHEYGDGFDHYVTVDAIYEPRISLMSFDYLQQVHKLNPIPVVHGGVPLKYVTEYLTRGCKIIGVGGMGQDTTVQNYIKWADRVFAYLCPPPHHKPIVKIHGFAVTTYQLLLRYPWWSVDSVSWAKAAGYGVTLIPHLRNGVFDFSEHPYSIATSCNSKAVSEKGRHFNTLNPNEQKVVLKWLKHIDVPLGSVDKKGNTVEFGIYSEYTARAIANLRFYEALRKWLGPWPRPFYAKRRLGFDHDNIPVIKAQPAKGKKTHIAYSGGSPITEVFLKHPSIMLSYLITAKATKIDAPNKPNSRLRTLMEVRRNARGLA